MYGERLKEMRTGLGFTQSDVASFLGISAPAYANYETGKSAPPLDKLIALAKYYKVSLDWLCGIEDGQAKKVEIKTQGDAIRAIDALIKTRCFDIERERDYRDGEPTGFIQLIPKRVCEKHFTKTSWFDDFMQGYIDLQSLHNSGKIKKKLFDLWLADELAKLDLQELEIPKTIQEILSEPEDDDGEVPF